MTPAQALDQLIPGWTASMGYSGWGGLSIEKVESQLPSELIPETFGLIHEYYTPSVIAKALAETLCPLLAELAGADGVVHALEPSAGIGRLLRGFTPRLRIEGST